MARGGQHGFYTQGSGQSPSQSKLRDPRWFVEPPALIPRERWRFTVELGWGRIWKRGPTDRWEGKQSATELEPGVEGNWWATRAERIWADWGFEPNTGTSSFSFFLLFSYFGFHFQISSLNSTLIHLSVSNLKQIPILVCHINPTIFGIITYLFYLFKFRGIIYNSIGMIVVGGLRLPKVLKNVIWQCFLSMQAGIFGIRLRVYRSMVKAKLDWNGRRSWRRMKRSWSYV
jgi:hypothetical protein